MEAVDEWLKERDQILTSLARKLTKAQRMKEFADKQRRDVNFEVRDWVLVNLRPHQQTTATEIKYSKLAKICTLLSYPTNRGSFVQAGIAADFKDSSRVSLLLIKTIPVHHDKHFSGITSFIRRQPTPH